MVCLTALLLGLLLTQLAVRLSLQSQNGAERAALQESLTLVSRGFDHELRRALSEFEVLAGFISASAVITQEEFSLFVDHLVTEGRPWRKLGWMPLVPEANRRQYERSRPILEPQGLRPRSEIREAYVPLSLVHPDAAGSPLGVDMLADTFRGPVLRQAWMAGAARIVPPVPLLEQGLKGGPYLVVVRPVAQADTDAAAEVPPRGFIAGLLNISDLLALARAAADQPSVRLKLENMGAQPVGDDGALIYYHAPASMQVGRASRSETVREVFTVKLPEQYWRLTVSSNFEPPTWFSAWPIWLTGLVLTGLLSIYLLQISISRSRLRKALTVRRQLSDEIEQRSRMGALAAELSSTLVGCSLSEIEPTVQQCLRRFADFVNAESAALFEFDESRSALRSLARFRRSDPDSSALLDLAVYADSPIMEALRRGECVQRSAAEMAQRGESREMEQLRRRQLGWMKLVPIHREQALSGVLLLGLLQPPKQDLYWRMDHLLTLIAQALAGAQTRVEMARKFERVERRLSRLAQQDGETGLPNAVELRSRIGVARERQQPQFLVYIQLQDLQWLDLVQDSLPIRTLYKTLQLRLAPLLRMDELLARVDEHALAIYSSSAHGLAREQVEAWLGELQSVLSASLSIGDQSHMLTYSIGLVDGTEATSGVQMDLLRAGRIAAESAAQQDDVSYRWFDADMLRAGSRRVQFRERMRRAIDAGEFKLQYQPQFDRSGRRCIGAEGLLRWQDTDGQWISPAQFVPAAEEFGLMEALAQRVFDCCANDHLAWRQQGLELPRIALNVSSVEFVSGQLAARVRALLSRPGIGPENLELEVTESVVVGDMDSVRAQLLALRDLGITLQIDDFGTGYSSMAYLKHLPVHGLKIDQSFVRDVLDDGNDQAILRAIVELASALKLQTTAEGVETQAHLDYMGRLGCQKMQGFYFSRAVPAAQFAAQFGRPVPNVA